MHKPITLNIYSLCLLRVTIPKIIYLGAIHKLIMQFACPYQIPRIKYLHKF